tara:strand:+ start:467 stop:664 length:198 start_codon:yes stop_codon:yes gene_type:complete
MKKKIKFIVGDTVRYFGKQAVIESFHKNKASIYLIRERKRELVYLNKIALDEADKWAVMVKSAED